MQYHNDHVVAIPQVLLHRFPRQAPLLDGTPEERIPGWSHTSSASSVGRNRYHSSATESWNERTSMVRGRTRRCLAVPRNSVLMWHGGGLECDCVCMNYFFLTCRMDEGRIKAAVINQLLAFSRARSFCKPIDGSLAMEKLTHWISFCNNSTIISSILTLNAFLLIHSSFALLFSHTTYANTRDTKRRPRSGSWLLATSIGSHRNFFLQLSRTPFLEQDAGV